MQFEGFISVGAVIGILVGVVECFFGYRLFKIILFLSGFAVGFFGAYAGFVGAGLEPGTALLVGLLVGVTLGFVFYFLHLLAIFLFGAILGFAIGMLIAGGGVVSIIVAVLGGVLALFLHRVFIILYTSFSGSMSVGLGITWLSMDSQAQYTLLTGYTNWEVNEALGTGLIITIALGVVGAIVQFITTRHAPMRITREEM